MRISKLSQWMAGGVAGCPGIIETAPADDQPTPSSALPDGSAGVTGDSAAQRPRRGRWVTGAATILVVYGALGIVYAPFLGGGAVWTFLGFGISPLTLVGVANVATGIGLLRLYGWARIAAALLSAVGLLYLHAPALIAAMATGAWYAVDWLGIIGSAVVLFAVLRRWPTGPTGAG